MQSVCGLAHQCSRFVRQTVDVGEARQPGRHIEGASAQPVVVPGDVLEAHGCQVG